MINIKEYNYYLSSHDSPNYFRKKTASNHRVITGRNSKKKWIKFGKIKEQSK